MSIEIKLSKSNKSALFAELFDFDNLISVFAEQTKAKCVMLVLVCEENRVELQFILWPDAYPVKFNGCINVLIQYIAEK